MSDSHVAPQAGMASLSAQPISQEVLLEKYAKGDERSVDDVRARVARALAAVEAPAQRARSGRRASSTRSAAASSRPGASTRPPAPALSATLINCFVQPVGDSIAAAPKRATPASTSR